MTQALYYAPSYHRLEKQITELAPELEVVLLDADGNLSLNGKPAKLSDVQPQWFWLHAEIMGSKTMLPYYFELMSQCPSASWLHTINTGLGMLPYEQVLQQGITVSINHSQAKAIGDFVLGYVLAHFQHHDQMRDYQANNVWKYTRFRELADTRWLIIGFGHIGKEIAKRAKAFDVHIDIVRRKQDTEGLADQVFTLSNSQQALRHADVVVLTCTSNDDTYNLVDATFLENMKEGSVLVNIARGDLVDETALLDSLEKGKPGKVILDVFQQEPLPKNSPLWKHPNVVLTPHCSNAGSGMMARTDALFLENLRLKLAGQALLNVVSDGA